MSLDGFPTSEPYPPASTHSFFRLVLSSCSDDLFNKDNQSRDIQLHMSSLMTAAFGGEGLKTQWVGSRFDVSASRFNCTPSP